MSRTYPTVITGFLPLHPPRPGVVRRLARWATRPLKRRLYKRAIAESDLRSAGYNEREQMYLAAFHDTAARQMRSLADVERAYVARLWLEMDQLERGENNG